MTGGLHFTSVAGGSYTSHCCGLTAAGAAWCWGSSRHGQLGDNSPVGSGFVPAPTPVAGNLQFTALSASWADTCGTTNDPTFVALRPDSATTCGVLATGVTRCWGDTTGGRLGNGEIGPDDLLSLPVWQFTPVPLLFIR